MDRKIINRIPVADSIKGNELVYGTDINGVPQYIPVSIIKESTTVAELSARLATEKADIVGIAHDRVEGLVKTANQILHDAKNILDECRNILSQTGHQKTRAVNLVDGVVSERETIERLSDEVRTNAFNAQLAKEFAEQSAKSASSKDSFEIITADFESGSEQTEYQVPAGWYAMMLVVDGRLRRKGQNKDWTSKYNGTVETIKLNVAPATNTWVSIICGRRH